MFKCNKCTAAPETRPEIYQKPIDLLKFRANLENS